MKGTKVGSYIIEEKIGEGGMGVVYSARHDRMHRPAVVKMLRKQLAQSPEMAKRFENEATAAASIGHPGIVQVFDIGQHQDGSLYIVMELLRGESLQQRLSRLGRLPMAEAVSIVRQAAGALGAAHKAGIVHRDLKPDNMFIVPDPEVAGGERVKLLDFGIAKLSGDGAAGMETKTGAMMGTPHYMSPEQCQGAGNVDSRSDLYALGCILFQLIAGRTPFTGAGVGDFIVAHMTQTPPPLRSFAPAAPQGLQDVVSTLLAKNPEERFGSCEALVNALGHLRFAEGPVLGTKPIARTEYVAPQDLVGYSQAPATGATYPPEQPATTMGLSAGESTRGMAPQAGYSASIVAAGPQRSSSKWLVVGILGALCVGGVSYALVTRAPPEVPKGAALVNAPLAAAEPEPPAETAGTGAQEPAASVPLAGAATTPAPKDAPPATPRTPMKHTTKPSKSKPVVVPSKAPPSATKELSLPEEKEPPPPPPEKKELPPSEKKEPPPAEPSKVPPPATDDARDRALVRTQLPQIKQGIQACGAKHHVRQKPLKLTVTIGLDGGVSKVKVSPPGLGPLATCIGDAVKQLRLAPRAAPKTLTIPFVLP